MTPKLFRWINAEVVDGVYDIKSGLIQYLPKNRPLENATWDDIKPCDFLILDDNDKMYQMRKSGKLQYISTFGHTPNTDLVTNFDPSGMHRKRNRREKRGKKKKD